MPHVTYKKVEREDMPALIEFDRLVFPPGDGFTVGDYSHLLSWWIYADGVRAGAMALALDRDLWLIDQDEPPYRPGTTYIASTGLLPEYQRQGIGTEAKSEQVALARANCMERIVTCCRTGNLGSRRLNEKFGFRVVDTIPGFYHDPPDDALVLELRLKSP